MTKFESESHKLAVKFPLLLKIIIIIISITIVKVYGNSDSLSVNYEDFDTFKKAGVVLYYDYQDSLTAIDIKGNNSTTFYKNSSKYSNNIRLNYRRDGGMFRYGGRFNGNFTSNEPLAKPSNHDFYFAPSIGKQFGALNSDLGAGFIHKKDDKWDNSGVNLYTENSYSSFKSQNNYRVGNFNFNYDNLDSLYNYKGDLVVGVKNYLYENDVYYGVNAKYRIDRYHYFNTKNELNNVENSEYEVNSSLDYDLPNGLSNSVLVDLKQNNKENFNQDSLFSKQDLFEIGFGNRLVLLKSDLNSQLKVYYKNRSEKFKIKGDENSSKDYRFSIDFENYYQPYQLELKAKYMKYQYKSLKDDNDNDKDILQFGIYPSIKFKLFEVDIKQTLNYDYYKLVNISSLKSGNNHRNYNLKSRTNYLYNFNNGVKVNGEISFNSRYQAYDYDSLYVKSFAIKYYNIADSISIAIEDGRVYYTNKLGYEEYGRLDFDNFYMEPENHKHHIYNSLGIVVEDKFISFGIEYFHYEIDTYIYDNEKYKNSSLDDVYIVHGPKVNLRITPFKKWYINSRAKYNLYRDREEFVLSIASGYRF